MHPQTNELMLKYLCKENTKIDLMEKYLMKDDGMTTGSTCITATQGVYGSLKKKKPKLFKRFVDEKSAFNIEDIIDVIGGEKFLKQKYHNKVDALRYINSKMRDIMKTFSLNQKDIDYNSIDIYLSKIYK